MVKISSTLMIIITAKIKVGIIASILVLFNSMLKVHLSREELGSVKYTLKNIAMSGINIG